MINWHLSFRIASQPVTNYQLRDNTNLMRPVIFLFGSIIAAAHPSHAQTNAPPPRGGPQIVSPEVHADRTVTFRVKASGATNVTVSGEWGTNSTKLTADDRGIWSATVGPLKPNLYG